MMGKLAYVSSSWLPLNPESRAKMKLVVKCLHQKSVVYSRRYPGVTHQYMILETESDLDTA